MLSANPDDVSTAEPEGLEARNEARESRASRAFSVSITAVNPYLNTTRSGARVTNTKRTSLEGESGLGRHEVVQTRVGCGGDVWAEDTDTRGAFAVDESGEHRGARVRLPHIPVPADCARNNGNKRNTNPESWVPIDNDKIDSSEGFDDDPE